MIKLRSTYLMKREAVFARRLERSTWSGWLASGRVKSLPDGRIALRQTLRSKSVSMSGMGWNERWISWMALKLTAKGL